VDVDVAMVPVGCRTPRGWAGVHRKMRNPRASIKARLPAAMAGHSQDVARSALRRSAIHAPGADPGPTSPQARYLPTPRRTYPPIRRCLLETYRLRTLPLLVAAAALGGCSLNALSLPDDAPAPEEIETTLFLVGD